MKLTRQFIGTMRPYHLALLGTTTLLSVISSFLTLPMELKMTFLGVLGALFFVTLGSLLQAIRSPGHGVTAWHLDRDPTYVRSFIREALDRGRNSGEGLEIDAMGIKAGTLSDMLDTLVGTLNWDSSRIRFLILKTGSRGAIQRAAIEGRRQFQLSTERGLEAALDLKDKITRKATTAIVSIKTFEFLPAFYIVRIGDVMLVGFYLKEKGTNSPYLLLRLEPDSFFPYFKRYFDAIFGSDLSAEYPGATDARESGREPPTRLPNNGTEPIR